MRCTGDGLDFDLMESVGLGRFNTPRRVEDNSASNDEGVPTVGKPEGKTVVAEATGKGDKEAAAENVHVELNK